MSENNMNNQVSTSNTKREASIKRRLKKQIRNRNWAIIALIILALLLLGHVIWCLTHHFVGTICTACMVPEDKCICTDLMNQYEEDNTALQQEIEDLRIQLTDTQIELENAKLQIPVNDGKCHSTCPEHCPDCSHKNAVPQEKYTTKIAKKKDLCYQELRHTWVWCPDCEQVVATKPAEVVKEVTEHDFNGDRTCDECGYKKPASSGGNNGGNGGGGYNDEPNATKEPQATATPTPKPTATPEPTATPKPTATPNDTVKPTECPHSETEVTATTEWDWKNVGEKDVCREGTRELTYSCKACGKKIEEKTETKTESHGEKKTSATEWEWWSERQTDLCGTRTRTVTETCTVCGFVTTDEQSKKDTEHNFDKYNQCTKCGLRRKMESGSGSADGEVPTSKNEVVYDDTEAASENAPAKENKQETVVTPENKDAGQQDDTITADRNETVYEDDEVAVPVA